MRLSLLIKLLDVSVLLTDCVLELDERVIELPDVRIFRGEGLFEAQERGVQLTDTPVDRFDFARGSLVQLLAPAEDACDQLAPSRCGSLGLDFAASIMRAAVAACAGDVNAQKKRR